MITYEKLLKKPQVAKSLVGMSLVEFDKFYAEFEKTHEERLQSSTTTRAGKKKRQRATGAGRKHKSRLLLDGKNFCNIPSAIPNLKLMVRYEDVYATDALPPSPDAALS